MEDFKIVKALWTEAEFSVMGWHDSIIYAVKFDQDISFDIDYIFNWVRPMTDPWFSFWVAPCTLVFEAPTKFSFHLESGDLYSDFEVCDIHRQINQYGKTEWRIETHIGEILIEAEHYKQFVRRPPTLQPGQQIIPQERGEVSFARSFDQDFVETQQVEKIKQEHFALRQKAKISRDLQRILSQLHERRLKGDIEIKQYILTKKDLERQILVIHTELTDNGLEHLADGNL